MSKDSREPIEYLYYLGETYAKELLHNNVPKISYGVWWKYIHDWNKLILETEITSVGRAGRHS